MSNHCYFPAMISQKKVGRLSWRMSQISKEISVIDINLGKSNGVTTRDNILKIQIII